MKRIILTLLALLMAAGLCTAQARQGSFTQRGKATQEMMDGGLCAAHSSLTIGSKARVINEANHKEVEVTITRRLPTSIDRIIDISPAAAAVLDIGFGGQVTVEQLSQTGSPAGISDSSPIVTAVSTPARAQTQSQTGNATQEMQGRDLGLSAAHSRIPPGSKVKVTNPANGRDIEVTIIDWIPESLRRIIDLSPSAALALGIGSGGPVVVTMYAEQTSLPAVEAEQDGSASPVNVTINNYMLNSDQPQPAETRPEDRPGRPRRSKPGPAMTEPETPAPVELPAAVVEPPAPVTEPVPAVVPEPVPQEEPQKPLFSAPPVYNVRIIPDRLPDPQSRKMYRLLVGVYHGVDNAFPVCQQLRAAGFAIAQEQAGDMCRVFVVGIPASMVYYAAQRLGSVGFDQVWVLEQ